MIKHFGFMISLNKTLSLLAITIITTTPVITQAQSANLINIPGAGGGGFDSYINAIYAMFISIAALLAVVKVIVAGVKYMFSDVVTQKSDAKRDIRAALLGLVVVLSAVLILTVINPDLTKFDLSLTKTQVVERPTVSESAVAKAKEACMESAACRFQSCTESCEDEIEACKDTGRVAQPVGDSAIACLAASRESVVEGEMTVANEIAANYIESNNEYDSVLEIYIINERDQRTNNDLSPTELAEMDETLPDQCELNSQGEENGNTYVTHEDTQRAVTVRMCVN